MDIWRSGTRTFRLPKVRHKMKGNNASNTNLEKLENKTLKQYGHVARMEDKR